MSRIIPDTITIKFSEMSSSLEGKVIARYATDGAFIYERAYLTLMSLARHYEKPDGIGYAKTDVEVKFADGESWTARLDIKHPDRGDHDCDVPRHVIEFLEFYAGRVPDDKLPEHLTPEGYRKFLSMHASQRPDLERWLDSYAWTVAHIAEASLSAAVSGPSAPMVEASP